MVTWQFQKSLPPLFVRIFISDLTLHRLQWPAAASRDSNTWKYWQLVARTAKLLHKPCKATLPRKPFQDCHPSASFLISGSNYYLQLLVKRLWFSIGCSQTSWVMGERKREATAGQKVRDRKVPSSGVSPADGLAAQGKCLSKIKITKLTTEKVVEVSGSGILDSVFDKGEKILSFDVKTPIC